MLKRLPKTAKYLPIGAAAKKLGVSVDTLRRWEKSTAITSYRLDGKNRYFKVSDLAHLEQATKKPHPAEHFVSPNQDDFTIGQAATLLSVSVDTIRRWDKQGKITTTRKANGERVLSRETVKGLSEAEHSDLIVPSQATNTHNNGFTGYTHPFIKRQAEIGPTVSPVLQPQTTYTSTLPIAEVATQTAASDKNYQALRPSRTTIFSFGVVVSLLLAGSLASRQGILPLLSGTKVINNTPAPEVLSQSVSTQSPGKIAQIDTTLGKVLAETTTILPKFKINADTTIAGTLTAPNIVYSITPGTNVTVTGDAQRPTISVTGIAEVDTLQSVSDRGATTTTALLLSGGLTTTTANFSNILNLGNLTTDPTTATNGATYYNTTDNKFRCYINGSWSNCDTTGSSSGGSMSSFTVSDSSSSFTVSDGNTFTLAAGSNVTLTTDTSNKKITIASSGGGGGGVSSLNSLTGALDIAGGGINTVSAVGTTITVTGTEADTLATVTGRGATTVTTLALNGGITSSSATPLALSSTAPVISFGNTGTLSITDGTNTLLSLADNGSTGTLTTDKLNLTATSNQIVLQSAGVTGTLTWIPASTNKTIILPNASGTVAVSASSPINLSAAGDISCSTCLVSGGSLWTAGATSGTTTQTVSQGGTLTFTAGTGISTTGSAGVITIANTGVTAIAGTANRISLSGATGSVTVNLDTTMWPNAGSTNTILLASAANTASWVSSTAANTCSDCLIQAPLTTGRNTITPATSGVIGLTVNGTNTGTATTALSVVQGGNASALTISASAITSTNLAGISNATTFTGTAAATSYGLLNTWASTQALGTSISQSYYGIYNTVAKTGADTTSGTLTSYGAYVAASNTGGDTAGTRITYGGVFTATGDASGTTTGYGLYVSAASSDTNYGVYVAAGSVNIQGLSASKGVFTDASKNLTSTGTLGFDQGGTGQTSYTDGQLLIGNTATGGLTKATLSPGTAIGITNGNGSITIDNTGVTAIAGTANRISLSGATGSVTVNLDTTQWPNATTGNTILLASGANTASWVANTGANTCSDCLIQAPLTTGRNTIQPATSGVVALTVNGTNTGTAATALSVLQAGDASGVTVAASALASTNLAGIKNTSTFTGTGTATSYGLANTWASTATLGTTISQNYYGIYNTLAKTGADTSSGTITSYGAYVTASNTGGDTAGIRLTYSGVFSAVGDSSGTTTSYGLYATATGSDTNYGLWVNAGSVNIQGLTASKGVFTDSNKNLTSTGTLGSDQGGTGFAIYTTGDLVYASATDTLSKLPRGSDTQCLTSNTTTILWGSCGGGARLDQITAANTTASIDSTTNAIVWDWSTASSQIGLTLSSSGTGLTTGDVLKVSSGTTGAITNGILNVTGTGNYTSTSNGGTLNVVADSTTAGTIEKISGAGLTTGVGLYISNGSSGITSGSLLKVAAGGTGAVATNGIVNFIHSGAFTSTSNIGFVNVQGNSTLTGTVASTFANALTTGVGQYISSTSTALTTGNLASVDWSPGSATTGTAELLSINQGANAYGEYYINLKDAGSSVLSASKVQLTTSLPTSFTAAGDVGIAYDINFTNPTASYIKSAAPLYLVAGETFNSSNLTLSTYNFGTTLVDSTLTTGSGTKYNLQINGGDTTSNANTNYGLFNTVTLTGNAAKIGFGMYTSTTSNSTTADTTYGLYASTSQTGAVTSGTVNTYGIYALPATSGVNTSTAAINVLGAYLAPSSTASTTATVNVYGGYSANTATVTSTGTINSYGFYAANASMNSTGTSTQYGFYAAAPSGADNNYMYYMGGAPATANTAGLCWDNSGDSAIYDCNGTPGDLAENFGTSDTSIEAGDIVAIDPTKQSEMVELADGAHGHTKTTKSYVIKANSPYQNTLVGIISTQPNQVYAEDGVFTGNENPRPVALAGRVPLKVSAINGSIHSGDYITVSSTAGIGMKATEPGFVVGQALNDWNSNDINAIGKIVVRVQVGYVDPTSAATTPSLPNTIVTSMHTATLATDVNEAGLALATLEQTLALKRINQSPLQTITTDKIVAGAEVLTAQVTTSKVLTNTLAEIRGRPLNVILSPAGQFVIQNSNSDTVARVDDLGNASFSGTIRADRIIANHIEGLEVLTNRLASLETEASHSANLTTALTFDTSSNEASFSAGVAGVATDAATGTSTKTWSISRAGDAIVQNIKALGTIIADAVTTKTLDVAENATIHGGLKVLSGTTQLPKTTVGGTLTVGTVSIDDVIGSIDSLAGDLKIQALGQGGVNFLNGKVTIDRAGTLTVQKLTVANTTAGTGTLLTGENKVDIQTPALTANSKVFVTAHKPVTLGVTNTNPATGTFTVSLTTPLVQDLEFDWWIVDVAASTN